MEKKDESIFDELLYKAKRYGCTNSTQFLIASFYSMAYSDLNISLLPYIDLDHDGREQFHQILVYRTKCNWSTSMLSDISRKLSELGYPREKYL